MSGESKTQVFDAGDYDSSFEGNERTAKRFKSKHDLLHKEPKKHEPKAPSSKFVEEYSKEAGRIQHMHFLALDAYSRHKKLINDYFLYHPGSTAFLKKDTSGYKRDIDVIKQHHKFLWDDDDENSDDDQTESWGKRLARRYYDKLFKEYCIADLSRYKENKTGMRWRIEKEVVNGKGQFICGSRGCDCDSDLSSWEVNFEYVEHSERKNALVKLRLCTACSKKLNYHHKKREIKRKKKQPKDDDDCHKPKKSKSRDGTETEASTSKGNEVNEKGEADIWTKVQQPVVEDERTLNEEMDDFLEDMFV